VTVETYTGIRLNLGGRDTHIPGFLVVDLHKSDNVDIRADVSNLAMFEDKTVDEIYCSHILEHFPHRKTLSVLEGWHRILKPGAKAYIAVPDFRALVKLYQLSGLNQFLVDLGWGGQEYPEAYHFTPFDFPRLAGLLVKAGFQDVKRLDAMPYGLKDCSQLMDSHYKVPTSLNVEATA